MTSFLVETKYSFRIALWVTNMKTKVYTNMKFIIDSSKVKIMHLREYLSKLLGRKGNIVYAINKLTMHNLTLILHTRSLHIWADLIKSCCIVSVIRCWTLQPPPGTTGAISIIQNIFLFVFKQTYADENLVTALVPSETACFASSPGSIKRTAVWISREDKVAFLL